MVRRAVYPGTFDPVTNGHLDLIKRARVLFDHVVVAVAAHPSKPALFSVEERISMVRSATKSWRNVMVEPLDGLLVRFAHERRCLAILRGLRAVADFEYEFQMALMNRQLAPHLETIYMMPSEVYTYLSSTIIKEVAQLGGHVKRFVPPAAAKLLAGKFAGREDATSKDTIQRTFWQR